MAMYQTSRPRTITDPRLRRMLAESPKMLVAVALAQRMAGIVSALVTKKDIPGLAPRPDRSGGQRREAVRGVGRTRNGQG